MSQPCSAVELILIDAREFVDPAIRDLLVLAEQRGVHRGVALDDGDIATLVQEAGCLDLVDFWMCGDENWPFDGVVALTGVEPERTIFISRDEAASAAASGFGLRAWDGPLSEIERTLP